MRKLCTTLVDAIGLPIFELARQGHRLATSNAMADTGRETELFLQRPQQTPLGILITHRHSPAQMH